MLATEYERGRKDEQEHNEWFKQEALKIARQHLSGPILSPIELVNVSKTKADYTNLTWGQRVVLGQIAKSPGIGEFSLLMRLEKMGIACPIVERIIKPVVASPLVEVDNESRVELKSGKVKIITDLLCADGLLEIFSEEGL
jgi:hypothetical protein